jgi:hypothetical protein
LEVGLNPHLVKTQLSRNPGNGEVMTQNGPESHIIKITIIIRRIRKLTDKLN